LFLCVVDDLAWFQAVGDLRLAHALVALKERYPSRVFLLMGNRDINKMKLSSDLAVKELQRPPEDVDYPYWLEKGDVVLGLS